MSYILDALKRADAERERGQVPGLHAQSIESSAPARGAGGGMPRWAVATGGGTALVIVAALAWRMGADANAPLPTPMVAPSPAPVPAPVVAAAPAPTPVVEPMQPVVAAAPVPAPTYEPPPAPAPRPAKPVVTRPAAAPAPAPVVARAAEPAPAPSIVIPLLADLPGSMRQQMPPLTVTGSVYSDDVHARFIMLNGEVVKEGGQPAPGVVVERIDPKSAVLRFKGQRFRLPY